MTWLKISFPSPQFKALARKQRTEPIAGFCRMQLRTEPIDIAELAALGTSSARKPE
jgi:hypothetical protein